MNFPGSGRASAKSACGSPHLTDAYASLPVAATRGEPLMKARSLCMTLPMNGIRRETAGERFRNEMNFAKAVKQHC
jgi:hypothetical protein